MNEQFAQLLRKADRLLDRLDAYLPAPLQTPAFETALAWRYRKRANGAAALEPVRHVALTALESLVEIEQQKARIVSNTRQFVNGQPANNVLLTGARGTGKSSLIKAVLKEFAPQGLRLIEVDKEDLTDLPDIVDAVAQAPFKFIIYSDDLSFDEGEKGYKALKSILDGSVAAATPNVLVYATSNRRHLLPEYMTDNLTVRHAEDGQIHPGEAVEEKVSLSERFGLWISFYPFSQDEYLSIVSEWLQGMGLPASELEPARQEALLWSLERGGSRSGRVAYQFARDYLGRIALQRSTPKNSARKDDAPKEQHATAQDGAPKEPT